jgi:hypothetical protein
MIGAPAQEAAMGNEIPSLYQAFLPPSVARMRRSLCLAALGCLLLAAPAPAHTIDVRSAADAVRETASTLGEVDRAKCLVLQTYQPWCATAPRDLPIDVQGLSY